MPHLNWFAVLAAAVSTFLIGGLWYAPVLFGRGWMSANGFTQENLAGDMVKIFGFALIFALLMSANLAAFLTDPKTTAAWGRRPASSQVSDGWLWGWR